MKPLIKAAIWEYTLPLSTEMVEHQMCPDASVVNIGWHPRYGPPIIAIYVRVFTEVTQREKRCFVIRGTGSEYDPDWKYLGAVSNGGFIWHVLECT